MTLSYSATSPAANTPSVAVSSLEFDADPAGLAELEARRAGEHHVRHDAGADDDRVGLELASRLGHHLRDATVGALEALELVIAVDR